MEARYASRVEREAHRPIEVSALALELSELTERPREFVAVVLFGVTGAVTLALGVAGLAGQNAGQAVLLAPAAVLIYAALLIDPRRRWTLGLGSAAGVCGVLVWGSLLITGSPDLLANLILFGFLAVSTWIVPALAMSPPGVHQADAERSQPTGWIEEVAVAESEESSGRGRVRLAEV